MTGMSNRELTGRLRAGGLPEPPADLLEHLKSEIPDDLAVGGDGLRLAERSERPRVVGIRQITLLAASLLVVVGTGFLAFTVLAPERSFLDRTTYEKVPEAYVVTVPPRIFVAAKREEQATEMQNAPVLAKRASGATVQPVIAEDMTTVTSGEPLAETTADPRRATRTGRTRVPPRALGGDNETDTVGAVQKDKAEVAAAAAPAAMNIVATAGKGAGTTAPAIPTAVALPASSGFGAGSPAAVDGLLVESRKTAASVVATHQEGDTARHEALAETGTAGTGAEVAGRSRAAAPARPYLVIANQADQAVILRDEKFATTAPGISLTVVPAGDGHEPAITLRDGQGRSLAAAGVTFTARSDGRVVVTHSGRDGVVRVALSGGEYRVEVRVTIASEPAVAMLHVDAAGWHVFPAPPASH